MIASPSRIAANQANALQDGPTGPGVVPPENDAAEVERRFVAFREELNPTGSLGLTLVRRAATLAVRMERCVDHESAHISERVRRALADFVPPEGMGAAEAERLRAEAGRLAAFDASDEASLVRKYEASAKRGFFRALKELRLLAKEAREVDPAVKAEAFRRELGSFSETDEMDAEFDALCAKYPDDAPTTRRDFAGPMTSDDLLTAYGRVDVPFSIGRPR